MRRWIIILVLMSTSMLVMISNARAVDSTRYDGSPADTSKWSISGADEQNPTTIYLYDTEMNIDYNYYSARVFLRLEELQNDLGAGSSSRTYDSAILRLVLTTINFGAGEELRYFARDITIGTWNQDSTSWDSATQDIAWSTPGGDLGSVRSDTFNITDAATIGDTFALYLDTGFVRSMIEQNNYGFCVLAEAVSGNAISFFGANQNSTQSRRPVCTVYHHETGPGEAAKPGRRRRILQ